MNKDFPKGFYWGAATASYQVEGGIENCDWAKAANSGKVPKCGKATDHYHLYERDFDIAKSLGHNSHRFSIEWARIEPEEGKFNEKEIEHYRRVIRSLRSRGIEPFVTLWHFTLPLWFSERGGFLHKDAPEAFARYSAYVVGQLGNEVKYWATMNEPLVWSSIGYVRGEWPPFRKSYFTFLSVLGPLSRAHRLAYRLIKEKNKKVELGIVKNNQYFISNFLPWNYLIAKLSDWFWNYRFLNSLDGNFDFIGLNHYSTHKIGGKLNVPQTDMGWYIFPEAIYKVLRGLKKYQKPIYVTENGIADEKDTQRASFIKGYLGQVKRAIDEGVPVKGYFYWSLLDNYEWAFGFTKRFGLVEVNYDTLERKIRQSAIVYKNIIEKNGL